MSTAFDHDAELDARAERRQEAIVADDPTCECDICAGVPGASCQGRPIWFSEAECALSPRVASALALAVWELRAMPGLAADEQRQVWRLYTALEGWRRAGRPRERAIHLRCEVS